jgi:endonuclease IV
MTAQIVAARNEADGEGFDMKAVALFVAGPRNRSMVLQDKEADQLAAYLKETGIKAIAHGTYQDVPWSGDPNAAAFVRKEVDMCHRAGISGLVVHLPNQPPEIVVKFLPRLYTTARDVRIYLETPAVSPSKSHYESPAKLQKLFQAIRTKVDPSLTRTGLCIDTAHLWSCGVDISSRENAEKWLQGLEKAADIIPPDRIMFHLNDSIYGCGAGRDEHATLLRGKMWGDYKESPEESGLAAFVDYAIKHSTPTILERKPASALLVDYRTLFTMSPALRLKDSATS